MGAGDVWPLEVQKMGETQPREGESRPGDGALTPGEGALTSGEGVSPPRELRVGVLAVQGSFCEHAHSLRSAFPRCNAPQWVRLSVRLVRCAAELAGLHALILPGGESTTMAKFLGKHGFFDALRDFIDGDRGHNIPYQPVVWGTCAGLIVLSNSVEDVKLGGQLTLGGLSVTASRNSYGRQLESFESSITLTNSSVIQDGSATYHGIFIRAPGIKTIDSNDVTVLATCSRHDRESVVAIQQGHIIATSFHPELTSDTRWHQYFINVALQLLV